MAMASNSAGTLYAVWHTGDVQAGLRGCTSPTDGGATWSAKQDVSLAPQGAHHAFPAIVTGDPGDYFEMDIDGSGLAHLVWGQGLN